MIQQQHCTVCCKVWPSLHKQFLNPSLVDCGNFMCRSLRSQITNDSIWNCWYSTSVEKDNICLAWLLIRSSFPVLLLCFVSLHSSHRTHHTNICLIIVNWRPTFSFHLIRTFHLISVSSVSFEAPSKAFLLPRCFRSWKALLVILVSLAFIPCVNLIVAFPLKGTEVRSCKKGFLRLFVLASVLPDDVCRAPTGRCCDVKRDIFCGDLGVITHTVSSEACHWPALINRRSAHLKCTPLGALYDVTAHSLKIVLIFLV